MKAFFEYSSISGEDLVAELSPSWRISQVLNENAAPFDEHESARRRDSWLLRLLAHSLDKKPQRLGVGAASEDCDETFLDS